MERGWDFDGRGDYCEKGWIGQAGIRMWTFFYAMVVSLYFILSNKRSCWNILSIGVIWSVYATLTPVAIMWGVD